MGPVQLLRPVVCYFSLAARRKVLGSKHCTRRVLGGVKCDDASSSPFWAARSQDGQFQCSGPRARFRESRSCFSDIPILRSLRRGLGTAYGILDMRRDEALSLSCAPLGGG